MKATLIRVSLLFLATFSLFAGALSPLDAAREFQREVEVSPSIDLLTGLMPKPRQEVSLPIAKVFDQGHTNWCWAFSAYHTLRTYYLAKADTAAAEEWKRAVESLDEQGTFRSFLGDHVSQGQTGEPMRFVRMLREEKSLPDDTWTPFMPEDGRWLDSPRAPQIDMSKVKHLSRNEIVSRVISSLEKGSPSAYCADPHCITIYGASYENGRPTEYFIADSIGGRTYHADARRMNQRLEYIATREW